MFKCDLLRIDVNWIAKNIVENEFDFSTCEHSKALEVLIMFFFVQPFKEHTSFKFKVGILDKYFPKFLDSILTKIFSFIIVDFCQYKLDEFKSFV